MAIADEHRQALLAAATGVLVDQAASDRD